MPNMTLAIPVDLKQKMDRFTEINWSEVARQAIAQKIQILEHMNQLLAKSKLTSPETGIHSKAISRQVFKKHKAA